MHLLQIRRVHWRCAGDGLILGIGFQHSEVLGAALLPVPAYLIQSSQE